jgi:hypothetical protein
MILSFYRIITSYSTTAAITLFLDIVIHPLGPQAQPDLELLISTANTMRSMPVCTLTKIDIDRLQEICNFVIRLVWLGTCAVMKAEKKNDMF